MSTFDQLKAEVVFNTFDGTKYLERAGMYINNAQRDVARRSVWGATEMTATVTALNSQQGTAPSPVGRITGVWSADMQGRKVDRYSYAGDVGSPGAQADSFSDAWSEPTYTVTTGVGGAATIVVQPVPAALHLVVAGSLVPAELADGGQVSDLGLEADDALILFARAKLYLREDDKEMHDGLMQSYMDEVRRFTLGTRQVAEGPRLTPGTWGDGSFGGI